MLINFKLFNQTFHIYQNHFISISNQLHLSCFHYDYQITNDAQLGGISQMSD